MKLLLNSNEKNSHCAINKDKKNQFNNYKEIKVFSFVHNILYFLYFYFI